MCHRRFPPPDITVNAIESPADILFGAEIPEADAAAETDREAASTRTAAAGGKAKDVEPRSRGAFTITDEGISWTCSQCETKNPLEAQICSVCGTTFAQVVQPKVEKPPRDANMAALLSLLLPGAGHAYIGSMGQAIARAIISLWVVSVVAFSLLAGGNSNSRIVGLVFAVVATGLWMITAHDAYREAKGEADSAILKGKAFLYVVLGLLMLLFVLLVSATLQASR
jgi:TM2 domain-containing membrane protein YozV